MNIFFKIQLSDFIYSVGINKKFNNKTNYYTNKPTYIYIFKEKYKKVKYIKFKKSEQK